MIQIVLKNSNSIESLPSEKPDWMEEKRWKDIQKLKAQVDKKRSFVSGYLLDSMCRDWGIENPDYGYTEKGKPFLNGVDCTFNISHSGDYAALAYHTSTNPIGVDIQKIRPMRDGMERRLLHIKEMKQLPEEYENRLHYLNRLWAVKESFVKMTGEGLSCDFRTVYADFDNGMVTGEDGVVARFSVWEWEEDYYLAVCSTGKEECEIKEI